MPTPLRWSVPTELSAAEATLAGKLHRVGKFYVFLRTIRSELFDDAFQAELAAVYQPRGTRPIPPALLAMVVLLQAYDQVGDAEAVENATVDHRDADDGSESRQSQGELTNEHGVILSNERVSSAGSGIRPDEASGRSHKRYPGDNSLRAQPIQPEEPAIDGHDFDPR